MRLVVAAGLVRLRPGLAARSAAGVELMGAEAAGMVVAGAAVAVAGPVVAAAVVGGEGAGSGMATGGAGKVVAVGHSQAHHRKVRSRCLEGPLMAMVVVEGSCYRVSERGLAVGGGN